MNIAATTGTGKKKRNPGLQRDPAQKTNSFAK
jgi:hypothetical protein